MLNVSVRTFCSKPELFLGRFVQNCNFVREGEGDTEGEGDFDSQEGRGDTEGDLPNLKPTQKRRGNPCQSDILRQRCERGVRGFLKTMLRSKH